MKAVLSAACRMSDYSAASTVGACVAMSFRALLMDTALSVSIILHHGLLPLVLPG